MNSSFARSQSPVHVTTKRQGEFGTRKHDVTVALTRPTFGGGENTGRKRPDAAVCVEACAVLVLPVLLDKLARRQEVAQTGSSEERLRQSLHPFVARKLEQWLHVIGVHEAKIKNTQLEIQDDSSTY